LEKNHSQPSQNLKYSNIEKKSILVLPIICLIALIIRFYYIPYGLPITLDGFTGYFLYALDISILGHLPNYTLSQSGWSEFLSLFFMNFHSEHLIDYMNLQRTISVILSGLTVIPIYFICRKFFSEYYSLIGAIIFAFEPRIILNSTLGISEPLYILAISLGILFFLSSNKKIMYSSFGFFAWATIIRPEGLFWFVAFFIVYSLRFRKKRKDLAMFLVCLAIFLLVLSPIVIHRIQCCGNDGIIGRILSEMSHYDSSSAELNFQINSISYGPNFVEGIKLFGWSVIPIFIIFVPIGLVSILKQLKYPNYLLILTPVVLSIPIIYSVSIAPDTRYVYPLFPLFCVISLFGIKWIVDNFNNKKIILGIIIFGIIIWSTIFLDYKKIDHVEDNEAYNISKSIINDIGGVNKGSKVVEFFKVAEIDNIWPITEFSGKLSESFKIKRFSTKEFKSLEEFIKFGKKNGLTHLVIDNNQDMPDFLMDVYNNEDKYQYLVKEYDSQEYGYTYHVKKFKINYQEFNN